MSRTEEPKVLLVIDGNNLTLRAFHAFARAGLTTEEGEPSGALYGVVSAFFRYLRLVEPTHVLWAFDSPGRSTYRVAIRSEYKANRASAEADKDERREEIDLAFGQVREFVVGMGMHLVAERGVEADDIIGQAVSEARSRDMSTVIISADHDLRQLVAADVMVVKPTLGHAGEVWYDVAKVIEEEGLPPDRLVLKWSLMGDSGDNIKGVPGIGPVRATKLLADGRSLEDVLATEPRCQGYDTLVRENRELIDLTAGHSRVDLDLDAADLWRSTIAENLMGFLDHYGFDSIITRAHEGQLI